ncbi:PREDICTED: probable thionin-2.4 [Camelina sativa]|uniref:Probable thionin-2.4 n=1 Tax=Camelina sativa TaxID=90675 RepID=A0ABM0VDJ1_CAMSA|nr:PREDICTED: probable thionin-2.4 [Camelina sativa]
MEGKTMILSMLIMSLMMAQIQVDAVVLKACCPTRAARIIYSACMVKGKGIQYCSDISKCQIVVANIVCPSLLPHDILGIAGDTVTEYCNLGCTSSVCGALTTLRDSDPSETVNGAVEQCVEICSTLCTKGSITAVETA